MIYVQRDKLSIFETTDYIQNISFVEIGNIIQEKINNVIYFASSNRLYGLVTFSDLLKAHSDGKKVVKINHSFTFVREGEYMTALRLFFDRPGINVLPVINKEGDIIGQYSRSDDILPINLGYGLDEKSIKLVAKSFNSIALVLPNRVFSYKENLIIDIQNRYLKYCQRVDVLYGAEIVDKINYYDGILTIDKNDLWAMGLFSIVKGADLLYKKQSTLIETVETMEILDVIEDTLREMEKNGIGIVNLYADLESEYAQDFIKQIIKKYNDKDINPRLNSDVIPDIAADFFCEFDSEEYRKYVGIDDGTGIQVVNGLSIPSDRNGKYKNYSGGVRKTCYQPTETKKTIWMFGQCFIRGAYVEDKHTVSSFLQKMLNDAGYEVKVINMGDCNFSLHRIRRLRFYFNQEIKKGDIVVTYFDNFKINGFHNVDLMEAVKESNPSPNWFTQHPFHCNYKVNEIYANKIYEVLVESQNLRSPSLRNPSVKQEEVFLIGKLFDNIRIEEYKTIGSVVMNCNPFTYGHRYLIEQAKQMCDLLIVFVVLEDKSVFSFNQRFAMVKKGTEDIKDVLVIPSGYNILSQKNFPEYFKKIDNEDTALNAKNDIEIFAQDIVPRLNIKKRFVGEELFDSVTAQYNEAMEKILPKYGVELVVIPRKQFDGKAISATYARECLENNDIESLKNIVPKSTIDVIFARQD